MNERMVRVIFHLLLTVTLFSLWAGFALLVVNKIFYKDLPGYVIGRICIWEFVAVLVAALIARLMIKAWGNIQLKKSEGKTEMVLNSRYGLYFTLYFLIAIAVGIWQFWLFSQKF